MTSAKSVDKKEEKQLRVNKSKAHIGTREVKRHRRMLHYDHTNDSKQSGNVHNILENDYVYS